MRLESRLSVRTEFLPLPVLMGWGVEELPPNRFRSSLFPAHSPHTSAPTAFKTLLVCVIAQD